MPDSILRCKSKDFAKQIVFLCRDVKSKYKESVLTSQLLRSGTSIGANIHEAQYAQGKKDFISKLEIVQKECVETEYWLELFLKPAILRNQHINRCKLNAVQSDEYCQDGFSNEKVNTLRTSRIHKDFRANGLEIR